MQDAQSKDLPYRPHQQYSSGLSATTLSLHHHERQGITP